MNHDAEPDRRGDAAEQPPAPAEPDDEGGGGSPRLTDEERRRYEAFVAEVFGPRCGDRC